MAVIASPSWAHHAQAVTLLGQGMDVLVEKPHRIPGQAPQALAEAIASSGKRYFVGMTTRHWPGVRAAARAAADGRLGRPLAYTDRIAYRLGPSDLAPWYFDPKTSGGGALLTNGVHAIDRARALLDSPLGLRSSALETVFPGHQCEDSAQLTLQAGNGVPVTLGILWSPYAAGRHGPADRRDRRASPGSKWTAPGWWRPPREKSGAAPSRSTSPSAPSGRRSATASPASGSTTSSPPSR